MELTTEEKLLTSLVLDAVADGSKASSLVIEVVSMLYTPGLAMRNPLYKVVRDRLAEDGNILLDLFDKLVTAGEMYEVQYTLPGREYVAKSFYLPKGSKIQISPDTFLHMQRKKGD